VTAGSSLGRATPSPSRRTFVLLDQLEWQGDQSSGVLSWDAKGWIGGDLNRLWFRFEG